MYLFLNKSIEGSYKRMGGRQDVQYNTSQQTILFTTSSKMNTIKTNTIDGVYTLDTNTNKEAFMKEIGKNSP